MTRFLVVLLLVLVLGLALDRGMNKLATKLRDNLRGGGRGGSSPRAPGSPTGMTETLVRCERCGVHVPRKQVVRDSRRRSYCSERCRQG